MDRQGAPAGTPVQARRGEDLLQDLLAGKAGDTKFNRGSVLEQLARLERGQGNVSASAGYYERAVAAFSEQREPNREILEHLEYARYLLTAAKSLPDALANAKTHLDSAALQAASANEFQARWRIEYEFGLLRKAPAIALAPSAGTGRPWNGWKRSAPDSANGKRGNLCSTTMSCRICMPVWPAC